MNGIIGKKVGMTRIFRESGEVVPVTLIQAGPCYVTQVKTVEKDGYRAAQIGYEKVDPKKITKPVAGHFKKAGSESFRHLKEFELPEGSEVKVGDQLTVEAFKEGDIVKVIGKSKGVGFAGVIKRYNFNGACATHGQSKVHRKPMSNGATDAARVFKGKRGPGRMGGDVKTVKGLEVAVVDAERNLIAVKGAIPGKPQGLIYILPN